MPTDTTPQPAELFTRAITTWAEGWAALSGASRTAGQQPPDPFQLWRRSLDQWLEGWTAYLEGLLQRPEAISASGRMLDSILNVEKPLRERTAAAMQFWLEFINMPSRKDLIRLAGNLNDANARLDELQDQIEALTDQIVQTPAAQGEGRRAAVRA